MFSAQLILENPLLSLLFLYIKTNCCPKLAESPSDLIGSFFFFNVDAWTLIGLFKHKHMVYFKPFHCSFTWMFRVYVLLTGLLNVIGFHEGLPYIWLGA